jgi:hypothetical protein
MPAFDFEGKPRTDGGDLVEVAFVQIDGGSDVAGQAADLGIVVRDCEDGMYACSFTATSVEGRWRLEVRCGGAHIQGSPFQPVVSAVLVFNFQFNFQFTNTTNNAGGITVSEGGRRVTKATKTGSDGAVATPALNGPECPGDAKLIWKVRVHNVQDGHCFGPPGIIANPTPAAGETYKDPTAYGWAYGARVWIAGKCHSGHGGWPGQSQWRPGDEAVFRLDLGTRELKMWHQRHGRVFTIGGLPAGQTWYIHTTFHYKDHSLEIMEASEEDRARF